MSAKKQNPRDQVSWVLRIDRVPKLGPFAFEESVRE
jgi:hypothetical protein